MPISPILPQFYPHLRTFENFENVRILLARPHKKQLYDIICLEYSENRAIPMVFRFLNSSIFKLDRHSDRNCFSIFSLSLVLVGKKVPVILF